MPLYNPMVIHRRNHLYGGCCNTNPFQRGTAFITSSGSAQYYGDRWVFWRATGTGNSTIIRDTTATLPGAGGANGVWRIQRTNASTETTDIHFEQTLPTQESLQLVGQTVCFSFWASTTGTLSTANIAGKIIYGTGTDQAIITGLTGQTTLATVSAAVGTTWVRYQVVGTIPLSATQVGVQISWTPTGTASTTDYLRYANLQLEVGSQPSDFEFLSPAEELLRCQRFYWSTYNTQVAAGTVTTLGTIFTWAETNFYPRMSTVKFPVEMRAAPTITFFSANGGSSGNIAEYNSGGTFIADRAGSSFDVSRHGFNWGSGGTFTAGNTVRPHIRAVAELV